LSGVYKGKMNYSVCFGGISTEPWNLLDTAE